MRTLVCFLSLSITACVDGDEMAAIVEPTCANQYPYVGSVSLPPMKRSAQPAPNAPVLTITRASIELDREPVSETELRERLVESHERLSRIAEYGGKVATDRIILAADANQPAVNIAYLLAAIHAAGFSEVLVLGAPTSKPELPPLPDPQLAARLHANTDAASRAMHAAQAIESAIWLCPDLTMIFSAIAAADPAYKCELVVAGFREMSALCMGGQDALVTVMLLMSVPEQYTTFRALRLAPEEPMGAGATWGELVKALPEKATRLGIQSAE